MPTPTPQARVPVAKALVGVSGVNDRLHSQQARTLLDSTYRQRAFLVQTGRSYLPEATVRLPLIELKRWLDGHPVASMETLRRDRQQLLGWLWAIARPVCRQPLTDRFNALIA